jgi:hypothetical protein
MPAALHRWGCHLIRCTSIVVLAFSASASVLKGEPPTFWRSCLIDRAPGCHETGTSIKAGTAAALKADYKRKAVAARGLFLQIHGTDDAAELLMHPM